MKKVFLALLICILVGATSLGVYAYVQNVNNINTIAKEGKLQTLLDNAVAVKDIAPVEVTSDVAISRIDQWKAEGLRAFLESKGYYIDDIDISISKYIEASILYNMTPEENDYIMGLVDNGYDFEKLVDIYIFLKNTNHDLSLMQEIYDQGANFPTAHWIENTYETIVFGDEGLSVEDIMTYTAQGITTDDIAMAFELSLKGDMRQIVKSSATLSEEDILW